MCGPGGDGGGLADGEAGSVSGDDHGGGLASVVQLIPGQRPPIHNGCMDWPAQDCTHARRCYPATGKIARRRRKTARHAGNEDEANSKRGKGGKAKKGTIKHQKLLEKKLGKKGRKIVKLNKQNRLLKKASVTDSNRRKGRK
jgi:hypothetical protein